jgi:hypothetical protein
MTDIEVWQEEGIRLSGSRERIESSGSRLMWEVGDWMVAGEDVVLKTLKKQKIRQMAAGISGYSSHTLRMAASVARKVEPDIRIDGLSWWHHQIVAKLDKEDQSKWLTHAAEAGWSVRDFRNELRKHGVTRTVSARRRHESLILELTKLHRDEIAAELRAELRRWWESELALEGAEEVE